MLQNRIQINYLEVLFVRHLQGDYVSTTGTTTVATTRASDGADDTIFDATEEVADARLDPCLKPTDPSEGNGHFVWFSISLFGTT